jgi:acyl-phosphate glycerol 3-phosphate acyltransferase
MGIAFSVLFPVLGYLSGSLPFSIWVTRYAKNVDVRDAGSGHATTTNTIRQAGFGWGALVGVLDLAKGFVPVYLATRYSSETWVVALTAALAVTGHCAGRPSRNFAEVWGWQRLTAHFLPSTGFHLLWVQPYY